MIDASAGEAPDLLCAVLEKEQTHRDADNAAEPGHPFNRELFGSVHLSPSLADDFLNSTWKDS
jgi:hypothetical protein